MERKGLFWFTMWSELQSMLHWPIAFRPVERQYIMVGAPGRTKLLTSWPGNKESEREPGFIMLLRGIPQ
jgi:hypothetical protein